MTVPFWCVVATFLLIYAPRLVVAHAQARQPEGLDNKDPREQQARLPPAARRANAAHQNTFEAFAPFAASVFVSHLAHGSAKWATILALVFVGCRVIYPVLYVTGIDKARSGLWVLGFLCTLGLFVLPVLPL